MALHLRVVGVVVLLLSVYPRDVQAQPAQSVQDPSGRSAPQAISRWFEPQVINLGMRYRGIEPSAGVGTNDIQDSATLRATVKFDAAGRIALTAGAATGNALGSGWNNTGLGSGTFGGALSVKELFLAVSPIRGVAAEYGGLYPVRGEATEVTSIDNDAYVTGGRVSVKRPRDLWLDDVTVTLAYLGDNTTPSVFSRLRRLPDVNYRQYLLGKKVGSRSGVSVEYDRFLGVGTYRTGAFVRVPELKAVDLVRVEFYRRRGAAPGSGFAIYGEKAVAPRFLVSGGYADIDAQPQVPNGDRYLRGKRVYTLCTAKIVRDVSLSFYLTRAVATRFPIPNKARAEAVVAYNLLPSVRRLLGTQ